MSGTTDANVIADSNVITGCQTQSLSVEDGTMDQSVIRSDKREHNAPNKNSKSNQGIKHKQLGYEGVDLSHETPGQSQIGQRSSEPGAKKKRLDVQTGHPTNNLTGNL
ncbi:unnamed protein product, partial [Lymnaea stagnalis]